MEGQFANSFNRAERMRGMTGENLLSLLERRFDNAVFRMGFASSRDQARQLVCHYHFLVNGKRVNIPSYLLRPGDRISVAESSRTAGVIKANIEAAEAKHPPAWMNVNLEKMEGEVLSIPKQQEIATDINVQHVVEFYSR